MSRRAFWGLAFVAFLVASVPIVVSVHPPLVDYLNHLARIAIVRDFAGVGRYWRPNPVLVPNLGFDYLMLAFAAWLPISVAGKAGVVAIIALWGFGFAGLYAEVHRRYDAWAYSGFLLVYTYPLIMGFLNFVMGLGLLFVVLALDLRWRGRPGWRGGLALVGGAALGITHLMAFLLAFVFAPLLELATGEGPLRRRLSATLPFLGPLLLPLVAFVAFSPTRGETGSVVTSGGKLKLEGLRYLPITGHAITDYAFVAAALVLVGVLLARRALRTDARLLAIAGVAAVLWILTPYGFKTTLNVDTRMPVLVGLFAALALAPTLRDSGKDSRLALAGTLGLVAARSAILGMQFSRETQAYRVIERQLAALPPDAAIICIRAPEGTGWTRSRWTPVMLHGAHLGVFQGKFVSGTFDFPTQQSIVVSPGYAPIDWQYVDASPDGRLGESLTTLRRSLSEMRARGLPHGPIYLYIMPALDPADPKGDAKIPEIPGVVPVARGKDYILARFDG